MLSNERDLDLAALRELFDSQQRLASEMLAAIDQGRLNRLATYSGKDCQIWRLIGRIDVSKEGDRDV